MQDDEHKWYSHDGGGIHECSERRRFRTSSQVPCQSEDRGELGQFGRLKTNGTDFQKAPHSSSRSRAGPNEEGCKEQDYAQDVRRDGDPLDPPRTDLANNHERNKRDRRPLNLEDPGTFSDWAGDVQDARRIDHGDAERRHNERRQEQSRIAYPALEEVTH
ncbi:uncharacterized protein METZ01_LOCUS33833 [marine metagenome]|uniref:Uncharacterized protein n=1 Tax=marine metagenome TaxID=408172 RepID=A0A381QQZ9_9ZZZZ